MLRRLAVVVDRVRERRPREPERREQQHHRRRDADADRVEAHLLRVGELHEEEAVGEVRHPQEQRRRHERDPEAVHLAKEPAVELEPELLTAVADEHGVDDQRAREVADDDADRPLVERDDEEQRRADRQEDVREARRDERDRALLDAEERGQLLVVHPGPEPDERGHDELRVVRRAEEEVRDRRGEEEAADEPGRRHRHREPEGRAQDEPACAGSGESK